MGGRCRGRAPSLTCDRAAPLEAKMEATYRIISQADGTFAAERTVPGQDPVISGHYKTEAEARAHIAELKKMVPLDRD
jgi:hypothetical protein